MGIGGLEVATDSSVSIKLAGTLLNWVRLSCFEHNLNLGMVKGMNDGRLQSGLRVCRSAVTVAEFSWS